MFKSLKTSDSEIREQLKIARQQVDVLQKCLSDKCDENDRIQTKVEILRKSLSQACEDREVLKLRIDESDKILQSLSVICQGLSLDFRGSLQRINSKLEPLEQLVECTIEEYKALILKQKVMSVTTKLETGHVCFGESRDRIFLSPPQIVDSVGEEGSGVSPHTPRTGSDEEHLDSRGLNSETSFQLIYGAVQDTSSTPEYIRKTMERIRNANSRNRAMCPSSGRTSSKQLHLDGAALSIDAESKDARPGHEQAQHEPRLDESTSTPDCFRLPTIEDEGSFVINPQSTEPIQMIEDRSLTLPDDSAILAGVAGRGDAEQILQIHNMSTNIGADPSLSDSAEALSQTGDSTVVDGLSGADTANNIPATVLSIAAEAEAAPAPGPAKCEAGNDATSQSDPAAVAGDAAVHQEVRHRTTSELERSIAGAEAVAGDKRNALKTAHDASADSSAILAREEAKLGARVGSLNKDKKLGVARDSPALDSSTGFEATPSAGCEIATGADAADMKVKQPMVDALTKREEQATTGAIEAQSNSGHDAAASATTVSRTAERDSAVGADATRAKGIHECSGAAEVAFVVADIAPSESVKHAVAGSDTAGFRAGEISLAETDVEAPRTVTETDVEAPRTAKAGQGVQDPEAGAKTAAWIVGSDAASEAGSKAAQDSAAGAEGVSKAVIDAAIESGWSAAHDVGVMAQATSSKAGTDAASECGSKTAHDAAAKSEVGVSKEGTGAVTEARFEAAHADGSKTETYAANEAGPKGAHDSAAAGEAAAGSKAGSDSETESAKEAGQDSACAGEAGASTAEAATDAAREGGSKAAHTCAAVLVGSPSEAGMDSARESGWNAAHEAGADAAGSKEGADAASEAGSKETQADAPKAGTDSAGQDSECAGDATASTAGADAASESGPKRAHDSAAEAEAAGAKGGADAAVEAGSRATLADASKPETDADSAAGPKRAHDSANADAAAAASNAATDVLSDAGSTAAHNSTSVLEAFPSKTDAATESRSKAAHETAADVASESGPTRAHESIVEAAGSKEGTGAAYKSEPKAVDCPAAAGEASASSTADAFKTGTDAAREADSKAVHDSAAGGEAAASKAGTGAVSDAGSKRAHDSAAAGEAAAGSKGGSDSETESAKEAGQDSACAGEAGASMAEAATDAAREGGSKVGVAAEPQTATDAASEAGSQETGAKGIHDAAASAATVSRTAERDSAVGADATRAKGIHECAGAAEVAFVVADIAPSESVKHAVAGCDTAVFRAGEISLAETDVEAPRTAKAGQGVQDPEAGAETAASIVGSDAASEAGSYTEPTAKPGQEPAAFSVAQDDKAANVAASAVASASVRSLTDRFSLVSRSSDKTVNSSDANATSLNGDTVSRSGAVPASTESELDRPAPRSAGAGLAGPEAERGPGPVAGGVLLDAVGAGPGGLGRRAMDQASSGTGTDVVEAGGVVVEADMVSLAHDGLRHALAGGCGFQRPEALEALGAASPMGDACRAGPPRVPGDGSEARPDQAPRRADGAQGEEEEELIVLSCRALWRAPA